MPRLQQRPPHRLTTQHAPGRAGDPAGVAGPAASGPSRSGSGRATSVPVEHPPRRAGRRARPRRRARRRHRRPDAVVAAARAAGRPRPARPHRRPAAGPPAPGRGLRRALRPASAAGLAARPGWSSRAARAHPARRPAGPALARRSAAAGSAAGCGRWSLGVVALSCIGQAGHCCRCRPTAEVIAAPLRALHRELGALGARRRRVHRDQRRADRARRCWRSSGSPAARRAPGGPGRPAARPRSWSPGPSSGRWSSSRPSTASPRWRPGRCAATCWRWPGATAPRCDDVLVADASPADDVAERLRLRLRLDPADRRLRHGARAAARRPDRVDRGARARPRLRRRRAHRHADRRARRRRRRGRARLAALAGGRCCAGRAPTGPATRGWSRCCCSCSPSARWSSTPVQNLVSRQIEARADLHALDLARDPAAFIAMQRAARRGNAGPARARRAVWQLALRLPPDRRPSGSAMARDWARLDAAGDPHPRRHQRLPAAAGRHPDLRRGAAGPPSAGLRGRAGLGLTRARPSTTRRCPIRWSGGRPAMLLPTPGDRPGRRRPRPPARLRQRLLRRRRAAGAARPGAARRRGPAGWSGATHGHETGWVALPGARQLLQRIAGGARRADLHQRLHPRPAGAGAGPARTRLAQLSPGVDVDALHAGGRRRARSGGGTGWGRRPSSSASPGWSPARGRTCSWPAGRGCSPGIPTRGCCWSAAARPRRRCAGRWRGRGWSGSVVLTGPVRARRAARALRGRATSSPCPAAPAAAGWTSRASAWSSWRRPPAAGPWWPARPAARRRRCRTASPGTWSTRARPRRWPTRSAGLLDDPARARAMGAAGRAWVEQRWSWDDDRRDLRRPARGLTPLRRRAPRPRRRTPS